MKFLLLVVSIVAVATATPIAEPNFITDLIIDCGTEGKIDYFEIHNCFSFPCYFASRNQYSYEIEFSTVQASKSVHLVVTAYWNGMQLTFIDVEAGEELEANIKYKLNYVLRVPGEILGEVDLEFVVIDKAEDHKVICGIVEGVVCDFC